MTSLAWKRDGVVIRPARPGDGTATQRLLALADPTRPHNFADVPRLVDDPTFLPSGWGPLHAFVADIGGVLIGAVMTVPVAQFLRQLDDRVDRQRLMEFSHECMIVSAVAVEPHAQRRGIGHALLRAAEDSVGAGGCQSVLLEFDPLVAGLARFYRKADYTLLGPDECLGVTFGDIELRYQASDGYRVASKGLGASVSSCATPQIE